MKKTVFITGSTRGIGRAVALEFALQNYTVILNGTRETNEARLLLKKVKKMSPDSTAYFFDVSDKEQVEKSCKTIIDRYGKVDVLINNAGILLNKLFIKMNYQEWDLIIKTNLYGPFLVTKQILPIMIKNNWGRIINMSSISGEIGDFGQTNYSASKAGLIGFTKSLAKETAKYNITVNAVCPGLVETDILKDIPKEYMNKMLEKIPLKRMAKTEEIAKLVLFLASEESSYITGSVININGGWI